MEALKFAFDTVIVGALALPWLALFVWMYFLPAESGDYENHMVLLGALPKGTREGAGAVLVFAMGYFLGSAVTRVSNNFFQDDLWRWLPTENSIRVGVYEHEYCDVHKALNGLKVPLQLPSAVGPAKQAEEDLCAEPSALKNDRARLENAGFPAAQPFPGATSREEKDRSRAQKRIVSELFQYQEGLLLLAGQDRTARLKEYHDQIIILRGAVLNGLALAIFSAFGICACYRANYRDPFKRALSYVPAVIFLAYGVLSVFSHFSEIGAPFKMNTLYRTPPLAAVVLVLFAVAGFAVCCRTKAEDARLFRNVWVLSLMLSVLAYGGWWWTEVMYDELVIHSTLQNTE